MYACTLFCTNSYTFQKENIINLQDNHKEFTVICHLRKMIAEPLLQRSNMSIEKSLSTDCTPAECYVPNMCVRFLSKNDCCPLLQRNNIFIENGTIWKNVLQCVLMILMDKPSYVSRVGNKIRLLPMIQQGMSCFVPQPDVQD